jgi:hypothetical protein
MPLLQQGLFIFTPPALKADQLSISLEISSIQGQIIR